MYKLLALSLFLLLQLAWFRPVLGLELEVPKSVPHSTEIPVPSNLNIDSIDTLKVDYPKFTNVNKHVIPKVELSFWERVQVGIGNVTDSLAKKSRVFSLMLEHPILSGLAIGVAVGVGWYFLALEGLSLAGVWATVRVISSRIISMIAKRLTSGALIKGSLAGLLSGATSIVSDLLNSRPVAWGKAFINTGWGFVSGAFIPVKALKVVMSVAAVGSVAFDYITGVRDLKVLTINAIISALFAIPAFYISEGINWRVGRVPIRHLFKNYIGQFARRELLRQIISGAVDIIKNQTALIMIPLINFIKNHISRLASRVYNTTKSLW